MNAWSERLESAMEHLRKTRKVFHSEADFQHALAWTLREQDAGEIRLEVPHRTEGPRIAIDLVVRRGGEQAAIELKYRKKGGRILQDGDEKFHHASQGAHDHGRYDFWADVARLERLVDRHDFAFGAAIVVTNDPLYWKAPARTGLLDDAFRMHHERVAPREMRWLRDDTGTSAQRRTPLTFTREHRCSWREFSAVDGAEFRSCTVLVEKRGPAA